MSDNMISDDSLSLDELELISGGVPKSHAAAEAQLTRVACPHCSSVCMVDLRKSSYVCIYCKKTNLISG